MTATTLKRLVLVSVSVLVVAAIGARVGSDKWATAKAPAMVEPSDSRVFGSTNDAKNNDQPPVGERPVLVATKTAIDVGEVAADSRQRYVFTLQNKGAGLLEIRAKSNCSCAVAKYEPSISPGGEGRIEAVLNLRGLKGKVRRTITLTTNDPDHSKIELAMIATVHNIIEIGPSDSVVLPLKSGIPTVKQFTIKLRHSEPVELRGVHCSVDYVKAVVEPAASRNSGGRDYDLTVIISPQAPLGRSEVLVAIETTSKREPQAQIRVACEKGIFAFPTRIILAPTRPGAPAERAFFVTKREGVFHIKKVECSDPAIAVKFEALKDGTQYRVTATNRGASAPKPNTVVRIQTDDPHQPKLEIPVLATR